MRHVVLVTGPPCAGKTSYVRQHAQPGDLVLDRDALRGERQMRDGLHRVAEMRDGQAWVIRCLPDPAERAALAREIHADEVLVLLPPREQLSIRARARPYAAGEFAAIDRWLRRYRPLPQDEPITGLWQMTDHSELRTARLEW
jgi:predicted kinase